jgi:hypothetical protein
MKGHLQNRVCMTEFISVQSGYLLLSILIFCSLHETFFSESLTHWKKRDVEANVYGKTFGTRYLSCVCYMQSVTGNLSMAGTQYVVFFLGRTPHQSFVTVLNIAFVTDEFDIYR